MKYFAISDIHGDYGAMITALNNAGYEQMNPNHQIVCCGDYFGRACQNRGDCVAIYEYLAVTPHANKPICLRGNHEDILLNIFRRGYCTYTDVYNGEDRTIADFSGVTQWDSRHDSSAINRAGNVLQEWLMGLPWYYETPKFFFTHGFVPSQIWEDGCAAEELDDSVWLDYSWAKTPNEVVYYCRRREPNKWNKHIVVGHWHAAEFNVDGEYGKIYTDTELNITFLDCCTALGDGMEVFVCED